MSGSPNNAKRLRLKFSLKWTMLLVTIACFGFGWFAKELHTSRFETAFVERIESLNDAAPNGKDPYIFHLYDYESGERGARRAMTGKPRGPAWLREIFDDNLFSRINQLSVKAKMRHADDLSFEEIKELKVGMLQSLERIELTGVREMQDLAIISRQRRLKDVSVQQCTELSSLNGLENHRNLESLKVHNYDSRLQDIDAIYRLNAIKTIELSVSSQFSVQKNWEVLAGMPELKTLELSNLGQPVVDSRSTSRRSRSQAKDKEDPEYVLSQERPYATEVVASDGHFVPSPCIEVLAFREVDLGLKDLSSFSAMPNLRVLEVTGSPTLESLSGLEKCAQLKQLSILRCPNLADIRAIGRLKNLESVSIKFSNRETLIPSLSSPNLMRLELVGLNGLEDFEFLGNKSTSLRYLNVTGSDLKSFKGLPRLANLKEFKLCNGKKVGNLASTTYLDLSNFDSLKDLDGLAVFPQLQHVDATACVELESIKGIEGVEYLSSFNWEGCVKIDKNEVKKLRRKRDVFHDMPYFK